MLVGHSRIKADARATGRRALCTKNHSCFAGVGVLIYSRADSSMRWRYLLLISSVSLLGMAEDRGPLPVELKWSAPPQCGDASEVLAQAQAMLKETSLARDRQQIFVEVTLQRISSGELQIYLNAAAGTATGGRTLVVADCAEAMHAAALLVTLMVSPRGSIDAVDQAPAKERNGSSAWSAPTPSALSQSPPTADSGRIAPATNTGRNAPAPRLEPATPHALPKHSDAILGWFLGLAGTIDHGTLPKTGVGASMRLGVNGQHWSVELRPSVWWPSRATSSELAGAGGDFRLYDLALFGCFRGNLARAWFGEGCLGGDAALLRGSGYGVTSVSSVQGSYLSGVFELALGWRLSDSWSWRLGAALAYTPERPTFAIRNLGVVHEPNTWSERVSLGVQRVF